jgi:hypothetical protein
MLLMLLVVDRSCGAHAPLLGLPIDVRLAICTRISPELRKPLRLVSKEAKRMCDLSIKKLSNRVEEPACLGNIAQQEAVLYRLLRARLESLQHLESLDLRISEGTVALLAVPGVSKVSSEQCAPWVVS